ncbi:Lipoprotein signal peptidase [Agreia sp. COWG]|jgi:signal peptidase II|nr:Lipoprotein signal peptidase [Agreia sp. COWG]
MVQDYLYSRRVTHLLSTLPRRRFVGALVAILVVVIGVFADQLVKEWAIEALPDSPPIEILPTFSLDLVFNPGVAFGMGADLGPLVGVILIGILISLTFWLAVLVWRGNHLVDTLLLSVVLAGGVGNVIDRVSRAPDSAPLTGEVVDYLAVSWFAIFNLADIFAVGGVLAWIVVVMARSRRLSVDE